MSGKRSLIIIGIVLTILIVCVYHFSVPAGRTLHLAPVVTPDDTTAADSAPQRMDSTMKH